MASQHLARAGRQAILHNGKGRPVLATPPARRAGTTNRSFSPLLANVPRRSQGLCRGTLSSSAGSVRALSFWSTPAKAPEVPTPSDAAAPASSTPDPEATVTESTPGASLSPLAPNKALPPEATPLDSFSSLEAPLPITEPYVGYLKELGIDFGWGPSSAVQWMIEHIQVGAGVPMVGAVVLSVVITRTLLLPLFISASDAQARLATMSPLLKPIQQRMQAANLAGNQQEMLSCRQEMMAINKRAGIRYRDIFMPMLMQIPLGYGLFRSTRAMAALPLPELQSSGLAWIADLTLPDPIYLLPAVTSGIMYMTLKLGGEAGETSGAGSPQLTKILRTVLPGISLLFTSFMPAITQIGFFAGSLWSFGQAALFKNSVTRNILGIHPLPAKGRPLPTGGAASGPAYAGTINKAGAQVVEAPEPKGIAASFVQKFSKATEKSRESLRDTAKTAREYANKRQKQHARLTPSELKSAETYEARKSKAEKEEAQWRAEAERRARLRKSPTHKK